MEAIEEFFEVKKTKLITPEMERMREISKIFNSTSSISEFKMKLDLVGISFERAEMEYTALVASKWPKFLELFKGKKSGIFSFKKYMEQSERTNTLSGLKAKPKLPWIIEKGKTKTEIKAAVGEKDRCFSCRCGSLKELEDLHGLDLEMELVQTMLYELAF